MPKFIDLTDDKDSILNDYLNTTMSKSAIAKKHLVSTDKLRQFLKQCGISHESDIQSKQSPQKILNKILQHANFTNT